MKSFTAYFQIYITFEIPTKTDLEHTGYEATLQPYYLKSLEISYKVP